MDQLDDQRWALTPPARFAALMVAVVVFWIVVLFVLPPPTKSAPNPDDPSIDILLLYPWGAVQP